MVRAEEGGEGMKRIVLVAVWAAIGAGLAPGQSVRSLVNGGNDLYHDQKFTDAEVNYRKALEKEPGLVQGHFNLGNALAKQGKAEDAIREYQNALGGATQRDTRAYAHYNIGNSFLQGQKFQEAVNSYVESLKLNPRDDEAKYNLSYALERLKQKQQQQQQPKNQQDKNKQQDQQKKQQQDQQQQQQQQKQQQDQRQSAAQKQQKTMSKEEAARILDVLKNSERDVQKRLRARQAVRPKTDKDW
jgi:tetratricopeptide (TPR) repeat protein